MTFRQGGGPRPVTAPVPRNPYDVTGLAVVTAGPAVPHPVRR
ncbi:hypothetical protein ACGFNX_04145 [Streptomyces sp. NPDC048723]